MKRNTLVNRMLSLLLLLAMFLGMLPVSAQAQEALPEEKPATKTAGKDYTADIEALEKPAAAYSTHYNKIKDIPSGSNGTVDEDNYVMLVKITADDITSCYAFAPGSLAAGYYSSIPAVPVTIDGDYLLFSDEAAVRKATITFIANTTEKYAHERLFKTREARAVVGYNYNNAPYFQVSAQGSSTFGFYYQPGYDGMTPYKGLKLNGATSNEAYYIGYDSGTSAFSLKKDPTFVKHAQNTKFYFYRMTNLTETLYNAIQNAKSYATGNANGTYDPELYAGFITCLEEAITLYSASNHYLSKDELARKDELSQALDTRAANLQSYMNFLTQSTYTARVNELTPAIGWENVHYDVTDRSNVLDMDNMYFIVSKPANGKYYVMDGSASAATGHIGAKEVTVENNSVVGATTAQAVDLIRNTQGTEQHVYHLRLQNGDFLRTEHFDGLPYLTRGHSHDPLGMQLIAGKDGIYLYRNAHRNADGTTPTTPKEKIVELYYSTDSADFTIRAQTSKGKVENTMYLYRLTWSTEALYDAIVKMAALADSKKGQIPQAMYDSFTTTLDESINLYLLYNASYTAEQLDQAPQIRDELKAQTQRLLSYENILKETYAQVIQSLETPYNELYKEPLVRNQLLSIVDKAFYIVNMVPTSNGTQGRVIDPSGDLAANEYLEAVTLPVSDGRVVGAVSDYAFMFETSYKASGEAYTSEFRPQPIYNMGFSVEKDPAFGDQATYPVAALRVNVQMGHATEPYSNGNTLYVNRDYDDDNNTTNDHYHLTYDASSDTFRYEKEASTVGRDNNVFRFFRVTSHVLELYKAIVSMECYTGGNGDKRYPEDIYSSFLTTLQEAIDLYQYYNTHVMLDQDESALKELLDGKAKELLDYAGTLSLNDTIVQYIDIPVEILDFRADGAMFEYLAGSFGLSSDYNITQYYGWAEDTLLPGRKEWPRFELADGSVVQVRVCTELTEYELVNGNLVYTQGTVNMIAYGILTGLHDYYDGMPGKNTVIGDRIAALANSVKNFEVESPSWMAVLGSWEDTLSKTSTPGKNGGSLTWQQVSTGTAYDLAYYILNYIWQPVSKDDLLSDGNPYNMIVPERKILRLYQDDDNPGMYTLDAYYRTQYTGSYAYNTYPRIESAVIQDAPNFTPIDGLGFESNRDSEAFLDTDRSQTLYKNMHYGTDGTNFHFTAHAKGSFVYYEEQDLYFEFLGDDDVYFYINGQRAMDLGGGHQAAGKKLSLNSIASTLGLEDGGVYSFDMFYAERHTSASNLKFSTNMQLMDPDLLTRKSQYYKETGEPITDGTAINVGTPVVYSFEMENRGKLPVKEVTFYDPSMGIYMSKDKVTIDSNLSNTKLSNLTLSFCSINPNTGKLYSGDISVHENWEYFETKLQGHVDGTKPITGHYTYTITEDDQLEKVLGIGIPANCQFSVYGMERNATAGRYINTVRSSARPITLDSNGNAILLTPVYGTASRNVYGIDLEEITVPEPLQVVLDYGKPIALPMNELWTRIKVKDTNLALDYVGLRLKGENGYVMGKLPANLFCNEETESMDTDIGSFTLDGDTPVFTLKKMMDREQLVYAVYHITLRDTKETVCYLMEEVQLLPATMMYYETDFADGIFTITSGSGKTVDNSGNTITATEPKEVQDDGTVVPGEAFVKTAREEKDYSHALFFDFSNNTVDQQRYTQPQYNGGNYDTKERWTFSQSSKDASFSETITPNTVLEHSGILSFSPAGTFPRTVEVTDETTGELTEKTVLSNSIHARATSLTYDPARAELLQIRFKLEGFKANNSDPFFRLWWSGTDPEGNTQNGYEDRILFGTTYSSNGEYMTITMDLISKHPNNGYYGPYTMREMKEITWVEVSFHQFAVTTDSKIIFDYIYIGPKNNAPVQHGQNSLYFTFDNRDSDRLRYEYPQYNGINPDTGNWTSHHYSNADGTKSNIHTFDNASGTISAPAKHTVDAGKGNNISFMLSGLNYPVANAEVFEVRAKLVGMTHASGSNIDFRYKTAANESAYIVYPTEYKPTKAEAESGEFVYYQIPLDNSFRSITTLTALRVTFETFGVTLGSQVIIDYIYLGPAADAPSKQGIFYSAPKDDFLYFDYKNDEEALLRYSSSVYNGMNFDLLKDGDSVCWEESLGIQARPKVSIDSDAETLVVTTGVDPYDPTKVVDGEDKNAERFYFQTGHNGDPLIQPLNYSPENAEVVQIRLKFKGFAPRPTGECPRLQFRTHADGYFYDENATNCTVVLGEVIPLDARFLDGDYYITLSTPVVDSVAKYGRLNTFRVDFLDFDWAQDGVPGMITIDYMYVGPKDSAPKTVYGYDSSYEDDTGLSNGSSLYMEGTGVKLPAKPDANGNLVEYTGEYTRVEFDFTGTGFDIISRTGDQTSALRMEVLDANGTAVKRITALTKGELELYQIPVISVQGLDHGTYHVNIDVNKAITSNIPELNRGNQFFFDAVRIYDPMDTTVAPLEGDVRHDTLAHLMDREDRTIVKEIRNILLSANDFSVLNGSGVGALFIDSYAKPTDPTIAPGTEETVTATSEELDITNHYAMDVLTYSKVGPKNEVYLDPGQAVAFKLLVDNSTDPFLSRHLLPISLDIGAKTINGTSADLIAAVVTKVSTTDSALTIATKTEVSLSSCTSLYRALEIDRNMFESEEKGKRYCYVVLYNATNVTDEGSDTVARNADHVISLTDIKICYVLDPTDSYEDSTGDTEILKRSTAVTDGADRISFMVDERTTYAAALVMKAILETPILEDGVKIGHSLNLASDIALNYAVKKTELEQYDSFYLECLIEGSEEPIRIEAVEKGDYYYFTLEGLTAVQMTEKVAATLYMEKNGRVYYSETDYYSIADYAYAQLAKDRAPEKLKLLCAQLLRYGSMAQIYKGYRTDALADSALTEAQKARLVELSTVTFGSNNTVLSEVTAPTVTWAGKALALDSKVTVRYIVDLRDGAPAPENLTLRVHYTDYSGTEQEVALTGAQAYSNKENRYAFDFDVLLAAELRTVLYAAVYDGDTQVSDTLVYSADTYGAGKTGPLGDVCKALIAYCDAAKNYFS